MEANELKLEDVMCGDWVDVRNNAAPNTPHLERITPSHFLRDEHWYGVELVPEILERNGFDNVIWQGEASWSYHENEVYVCISGRSGGIKHFGYNGWDSKIAIFSVHQLQHALRLCGIEKEIEL